MTKNSIDERELKIRFGEHLGKLIKKKYPTFENFAYSHSDLKLTKSTVYKICRGDFMPRILTIFKIAEALEISPKKMFDFKIK